MSIMARAPNRVDFAGGTLDIYPLYLFLDGGLTVNVATQIYSTAEVDAHPDSGFSFHSKDLQKELNHNSLLECVPQGDLSLLVRAVKFFAPSNGIKLITHNEAPQGSGLGASSALLVAVTAAISQYNGDRLSLEDMTDLAANLEAQTIRIPTGKQDYLAALYGGVHAYWFDEKGIRIESLDFSEQDIAELESRVILSYTGIPHFSGENNWDIMRRFIDGDLQTIKALSAIKVTTLKMREALLARDWDKVGQALGEEWENRKKLARGVTTEKIEQWMAKAHEAGAEASKLCGAGGGGCMVTWCEPPKKEVVRSTLTALGAQILPFRVSSKGLKISKKSAKASKRSPVPV